MWCYNIYRYEIEFECFKILFTNLTILFQKCRYEICFDWTRNKKNMDEEKKLKCTSDMQNNCILLRKKLEFRISFSKIPINNHLFQKNAS